MRDRQTADVFIQITSLDTNNGGDEYTLEFYGQGRFDGMIDTIQYIVQPNVAEAVRRDLILNNLKKGLLPYIVKTDLISDLSYQIDSEITNTDPEEINDPWKLWTFNVRGNVNINGQENINNTRLFGRFSFDKVTEDWKWESRVSYNYTRNYFQIDSVESVTSIITNSSYRTTYVKSISDHFSVGIEGSLQENSFSNFVLSMRAQPAIEYNFYPYSEANNRQFTIKYQLGPQYNNYVDSTIFEKKTELLYRQDLDFNLVRIEEWGNLYFNINFSSFLHDPKLFAAYINPNVDINILKGLFFNIGGSVGWIRNQINIPISDASKEDILLQIRQLQSNYSYFMYAGFGYRFGSNVSNIVNIRF